MAQANDLLVFITRRETTCSECGEDLGQKAWITLIKDRGALCLSDSEVRKRRREREASRRAEIDQKYIESTVRLAVTAHIRHAETQYDTLLAEGYEREFARAQVMEKVDNILAAWQALQ